jgi:hypothetical protein
MRPFIAVFALLLTGCDSERVAQLEKQNAELTTKLESLSKASDMALQEKCASQADRFAKQGGWDNQQLTDITNHYNVKLGKCLVMIENTDVKTGRVEGMVYHSKDLFDAFEKQHYGEFVSSWSQKAGQTTFPLCSVTSISGELAKCSSSEEFEALIKPYFQP